MKNIVLSTVAVLAMSTFAVAGGDIAPVEEPVVVVEPVVSDAGFYLGLGYGYFAEDVEIDVTNFDDTYTMHTVMFQAGYKFNSYVAVEGRYWLGVSDLEKDSTNEKQAGDYSSWGIYVKPMYPVSDVFNIYALLGYASTTLEPDNTNIKFLDTDSFSWGIGAEYEFTENLSIFADYVAVGYTDEFTFNGNDLFEDDVDVSIGTVNFGLTYKF